ncbi:hypothetical protein [Cystobacter ferrugineus]|uniref:PilC beta-propeller domain-containing protein n=1 Tax=Cystobacter ferrugineus TaxID=83449 RepID=A0A1L9BIQ6_9BACT|nr:hypothetical protein [Cystobacter ferrugineus]OJH42137.1 hypothetical protein BON30_02660 [Cystobacter ferrugineus]
MMRINFDTLRRAWKSSFSRKVALASGAVVVGATGLAALESRSGLLGTPADAACCTGAVATGDSMISPPQGADKDFFELPSSPPSVFFLLGTNRSMQEFAYDPKLRSYLRDAAGKEQTNTGYLPEVFSSTHTSPGPVYNDTKRGNFVNTGCDDPELIKAMSWFEKGSSDPEKNGSTIYDPDPDLGGDEFFNPGEFYHSRGWRVSWNGNNEDLPYSMNADFKGTVSDSNVTNMCRQVWGGDGSYTKLPALYYFNECIRCLSSKGWWRGPIAPFTEKENGHLGPPQYKDEPQFPKEAYRKWVVSGRILNLHPPKFVVARKVLKDIIDKAENVRMGVATFGEDRGWYDPPWVLADIEPSCPKSYPVIDEAELNRPNLKRKVNTAKFRHNERAIGEALFGLGGYFSSQGVDQRWTKWFDQTLIGNNTPKYSEGWNGWPGQPNGGIFDNPIWPKQSGGAYGESGDEWLKQQYTYTDPATGNLITLPGQRFEQGGSNKAVCFPCQVSSVIVLTDGTPKYDNSVPITKMMKLLVDAGARHETPGKELVTFDPSDPRNNLNSGGINYCGDFGVSKFDCDYTDYNWPHGLAKGNMNFMDDVAFFLAHSDLRTADGQEAQSKGVQSMRTYTVGYGDNSPMLQSIAKAGKGKFYRADNGQQLHDAIINALGDIKQQSTSFASANISGVQTGGMESSTFVPRFIPRRDRPYEGHLYRFFYFNEFAQGCKPTKPPATPHARDLNGDGDCDDAFFLDKPSGFDGKVAKIENFTKLDIVQENDEGVWVQAATGVVDEKGVLKGGLPAEPFWDVSETLNLRKAGLKCDFDNPLNPVGGRCIFTLIDRNKDSKFTAEDNPPVEFHEENVAQLKEYLLAAGDTFCSTMFSRGGQSTGYNPSSAEDQSKCASLLIRFVRGVDVFDIDGDNERAEGRPCADDLLDSPAPNTGSTDAEDRQHQKGQKTCKLADIFHSSPVTVEPPVEPFLCSLGLSSQCVSTLYDDFSYSVTSEPLCGTGGSATPCYKATPMSPPRSASKPYGAYEEHVKPKPEDTEGLKVARRDRIALVGSNGGMLHAIHVGTYNAAASTKGPVYDVGTGQELWAFVPPDLMPRLNQMVSGHDYYVDGTAMVRDIWADGAPSDLSRDGKKEKTEFRTIAVMSERGGGQRYMALDVTDPYLMLKAAKNQADGSLKPFRWMFPNACDKESLTMGQSWLNFAPKPPPIGPVRLKASESGPTSDKERGWEERWVAMLNGGYSPDLSRGRGVYMVDAWTGEKVWAAEARPGANAGSYAAVLNTMQPVVASVSMVDIGKAEGLQRDMDGFFDTMVVGDMGGQVWTFRFKEPGVVDTTTGVVKNWFGARSLEVQRSDGAVNGHEKAPFFHVASTVLQPDTGWLRAFLGTGDRQHLRTSPGTDCSADDLLACIRLKCDVKATFVGELNGQQRNSTIEYKGGVLTSNAESWQNTIGSACSSAKMELTELTYSCPASAYGSATYPPLTLSTKSSCSLTGGSWECTHSPLNTFDDHDQLLSPEEEVTVGTNRYFGFHAYGGSKRVFNDEAGAIAFDKLRLTDKPNFTCEGQNCSLVDMTIPDNLYSKLPAVNGVEQRYITDVNLAVMRNKAPGSSSPGWFIRYTNNKAERTASGSTVLAGVVFWSSFAPYTEKNADVCSLAGMNDRSYSWQASAITGLPDMAAGFRTTDGVIASREAKTQAPPGEPTPVIAISKAGTISYQVALSSAGSAPTNETLKTRANATPDISWMEVPRNLHECRHENSDACSEEEASASTP